MILILTAALLGCHGNDDTGNPVDPSTLDGEKQGTATLTYDFSVMGEIEPSQITAICGDETFSVPSGETIEVAAPTSCTVTAGVELVGFEFPVHLAEDGEYWAASPLTVTAQPGDALTGVFESFNMFRPGDYVCWYDEYQLDESAPDMRGSQVRDHVVIDKQRIAIAQSGVVELEDDQNMSVIGRDDDHMQVIDDELILVVARGGNPYYISDSNIYTDDFSLTVVNTEAGYVADVWCERDDE